MGLFDRGPNGAPSRVPSPTVARSLVLFKYDSCPYCQRVLRHAKSLGVSLETRDTLMERAARDELVRLTGGTQVPMLLIDGVPLLESADINRWLDAYAARPAGQA